MPKGPLLLQEHYIPWREPGNYKAKIEAKPIFVTLSLIGRSIGKHLFANIILEGSYLRFLGINEKTLSRTTFFLAKPSYCFAYLCHDNVKMIIMHLIKIYHAVQELWPFSRKDLDRPK